MRQLVLDTETTGREISEGNRIIEVGCVELVNRRLTNNNFQRYINPERSSEAGALAVHGLTDGFLRDYPVFKIIVEEFIEFIRGAELIIHNAEFDLGFLNMELMLASKILGKNYGKISDYCTVIDTLAIARQLHPGQRNSLDALCKRYNIDNAHRNLHGALLDAELLALVYLAMTGGQTTLFIEEATNTSGQISIQHREVNKKAPLKIIQANADELAAHESRLAAISKAAQDGCVWNK
jgi:DNA polymerase-3 subunit epsilon